MADRDQYLDQAVLDPDAYGVADESWWQRICDGLGHAFVAPDFFRMDAVREWLASEQVRSDLRNLARARLLGEQADDVAARGRLRAAYMAATGEAKRFAEDRVEVALGVLAGGFVGSVDRALELIVGLQQAAARENRALHRETHAQLAEVGDAVAAVWGCCARRPVATG
jgi:hypothetical protein